MRTVTLAWLKKMKAKHYWCDEHFKLHVARLQEQQGSKDTFEWSIDAIEKHIDDPDPGTRATLENGVAYLLSVLTNNACMGDACDRVDRPDGPYNAYYDHNDLAARQEIAQIYFDAAEAFFSARKESA